MSKDLPHMEESDLTTYYPPAGSYVEFDSEDHYEEKGREWGLFSKTPKTEFWYKGKHYKRQVVIKGYEEYGSTNILVIQFHDKNLSCIHPGYLKEMQSPNFGKESVITSDPEEEVSVEPVKAAEAKREKKVPAKPSPSIKNNPEKPALNKTAGAKKEKVALPEEKVRMKAQIASFDAKYNTFTEEDDEVILLQHLSILQDEPVVLGEAWAGYSKTLKKLSLQEADWLEFEGKVVRKSFNKEIRYKVNNPSKMTVTAAE